MNKPFQVYSFDIRKYSVYNRRSDSNDKNKTPSEDGWYHFPQRSDISIHFFKFSSTQNINISILWNGTTMDKTNINVLNKDITSVIARYPAIGFKQSSGSGILLKRFQISFAVEEDYDRCLDCLKDELKFPIDSLTRKSEKKTIQNLPVTMKSISESQNVVSKSQSDTISPLLINSYPNNAYSSLNNVSLYSQENNNNLQSGNFFQLRNNFRENTLFPLSQVHANQEFQMNGQSDLVSTTNYNSNQYSQMYHQSQIPSRDYSELQILHPFTQNQNQQFLNLPHQTHCFSKNMQQPIELPRQIEVGSIKQSEETPASIFPKENDFDKEDPHIFTLQEDKLKELIKDKLKDKAFIDFVVRLERILHNEGNA